MTILEVLEKAWSKPAASLSNLLWSYHASISAYQHGRTWWSVQLSWSSRWKCHFLFNLYKIASEFQFPTPTFAQSTFYQYTFLCSWTSLMTFVLIQWRGGSSVATNFRTKASFIYDTLYISRTWKTLWFKAKCSKVKEGQNENCLGKLNQAIQAFITWAHTIIFCGTHIITWLSYCAHYCGLWTTWFLNP